jgi:ParB-like chromosome segregation protein Spo0J
MQISCLDYSRKTEMVSVADIIVMRPRRQADTATVKMLAESIALGRLLNPITVLERADTTDFILIAGLHRLEAFRHLERNTIPAFILPASTTEAEARMMEISENLHRAELTELERAEQIEEWRELAKARKISDPLNRQPHELGNSQTARELGIDEKAVRNASKIASITPEAKEAAREAGIDNNQSKLRKVAAAPAEQQVEAVHKIAGARALMADRQEPADSLDFFPTPPWATRALMERVFPHLGVIPSGLALEPACGEGHMAEPLAEYFRRVIATDIFDYGYGEAAVDFLSEDTSREADWLITNPPFGDKTVPFVLRALKLARVGVAVFQRLQWVETIERYESIFRDCAPTLVAFFVERVCLCKGRWDPDGSTATAYAWFTWIHGEAPRPPFWIPPGCSERLTHPDDPIRFTTHPVTRKAVPPKATPPDDGLDIPPIFDRRRRSA